MHVFSRSKYPIRKKEGPLFFYIFKMYFNFQRGDTFFFIHFFLMQRFSLEFYATLSPVHQVIRYQSVFFKKLIFFFVFC